MSRIWIWTLTMGFVGALGAPGAFGESRGDANRFKQDVLKVVDRLMDKKLKEFRNDLMRDIKKMLAQGRQGRDAPRIAQARKKYVQMKKLQDRKGREGPSIRIQGPKHVERQSEVQVMRGPDGKVHVRVVKDGKVMEREFEAADPRMHQWMKKMVPGGMHIEPGKEGRSRRKVRSGGSGRVFVIEEEEEDEEDEEEGCECERRKGFSFRVPFVRREGKGPRVRIEGMGKAFPFGEGFDARDLGPWIRRMIEQWKKQGFEPERIREFVKRFQGPRGRSMRERMRPLERAGRGMQRALQRNKPMERLVRQAKPRIRDEVKELEKEKENLRRELAQIQELLKRLIEQRRRR